MSPHDIVQFWADSGPDRWFKMDEAFDAELRVRFEAAHHGAARGAYSAWEAIADGALALLLLLDQIPRNLYRNSPHAFATDGLAVRVAGRARARGFDMRMPLPLRIFFYLPFEHAENLGLQAQSVALFETTGDADYMKYAILHRNIIARFGRFPHRNSALGRTTTTEEQAFLDGGGFAG